MFTRIAEAYRDRTAIVIGAGGIGGAIAQLLVGGVKNLIIADHNTQLLGSLKFPESPTRIVTRPIDVRDTNSVNTLFETSIADFGTVDYLFYTAGILNLEPLSQTSSEIWDRAVDVNLNGAFYCVQAAAERMRPQHRGSILLLGSIAGTKSRSGSRVNPVYNTTKAGLAAFVNAAAMQLRRDGIRINCISPGPTETPMMDLQPPAVHSAVNEITLDNRMNRAQEVAETALFVAAHGRFTGEEICMGGGAGLGG